MKTLNELIDKHIGKIGTKERDLFELKSNIDALKSQLKIAKRKYKKLLSKK